jgi:hypothetical protein
MCPTITWKELKLASRVGDFTIIVGCKGRSRIERHKNVIKKKFAIKISIFSWRFHNNSGLEISGEI